MQENVQLYVNSTKAEAISTSSKIKTALLMQGYNIVEKNPNIVIGFGGDGTLLHYLSENNFNSYAKYIGVNCGTLGFLQNFNVSDENTFVKNIPNYIEQKLSFIELEVENKNGISTYYALNEFAIHDNDDQAFKTTINICNEFLENYVGTGIIFSTPTGSTALNLSRVVVLFTHKLKLFK